MEGRHWKKKCKKERNASKCRTVQRRSVKGTGEDGGEESTVLEPGWCLNQPSRLGHLGPLWVEDRASNGCELSSK